MAGAKAPENDPLFSRKAVPGEQCALGRGRKYVPCRAITSSLQVKLLITIDLIMRASVWCRYGEGRSIFCKGRKESDQFGVGGRDVLSRSC